MNPRTEHHKMMLKLITTQRVTFSLLILASLFGCSRGPKYDDATKLMMEAHEAETAGNKELAVEKITEAIQSNPDDFGILFRRAKLLAELGRDEEANADIDRCAELEPDHADVDWLKIEMKKPVEQRFGAAPPSHAK